MTKPWWVIQGSGWTSREPDFLKLTSTARRPQVVQAAVGDLLDLMGHHGGRELILNAILFKLSPTCNS